MAILDAVVDAGKGGRQLVCDRLVIPDDYPFVLFVLIYGNVFVLVSRKHVLFLSVGRVSKKKYAPHTPYDCHGNGLLTLCTSLHNGFVDSYSFSDVCLLCK